MKKTLTVSILTLAFMGGFLVFYNSKPVPSPQKWESRIDDQENVTVTITPIAIDLSSETAEWKFDVVLSTHSVELDQDMVQVAALVDDGGNEYKPLRWEGAPAGGHHREGLLIFSPVAPYPRNLKLIVNDVGGAQRLFEWTLVK